MKNISKKMLLSAAVTGLVAVSLSSARADDGKKMDMGADGSKQYECKGGNSCKGKGDCGGPGYSCAGNNACCGKGFVQTKSEDECKALVAKLAADKTCTKKTKSGKSKSKKSA